MKKLRRITEAEVISEFLKNEFYQEEFDSDREHFEPLVMSTDLDNDHENRTRQALLFRRRGHMWRELPDDTRWWEVELGPADFERVRIFPRAHWRKIADGNFKVSAIVERIRNGKFSSSVSDFITKIQSLSNQLRVVDERSTVIIIAEDESSPITVIEGNHRLTASMLGSAEKPQSGFRFFLGLSPKMSEVCWYRNNFHNLLKYAKNRLKHLLAGEPAVPEMLARPRISSRPRDYSVSGSNATSRSE